jgi:hypothetical protein
MGKCPFQGPLSSFGVLSKNYNIRGILVFRGILA